MLPERYWRHPCNPEVPYLSKPSTAHPDSSDLVRTSRRGPLSDLRKRRPSQPSPPTMGRMGGTDFSTTTPARNVAEVRVGLSQDASLIKTRQRMADHGEVFTPAWVVEAMLDLVSDETERIDSRFLEPACGSGNFLVLVLRRKLAVVDRRFGRSDFEKRHYSLFGLMCIYGIELLEDNIAECRSNLLEVFSAYLDLRESDDLARAAAHVLAANIVQADALTLRTTAGDPIVFPEWGYLGKGRFQRRDFRFENLTQSAAFGQEGTLFAELGMHEIFTPTETYPQMTIEDLRS